MKTDFLPAAVTGRAALAMVSVHVDSPSRSFLVLLPCSSLVSPGPYRVPLLRAPAPPLPFPLGLQRCVSHSCSPSLIADGECFALCEQMLSLRHCRSGGRAHMNPAVAALELSGTGCGHCLAATDTPHAALPAAPATVRAAALHRTSSGGSHYSLIFLFWSNAKCSVLKFIPASTEGRCTEL